MFLSLFADDSVMLNICSSIYRAVLALCVYPLQYSDYGTRGIHACIPQRRRFKSVFETIAGIATDTTKTHVRLRASTGTSWSNLGQLP